MENVLTHEFIAENLEGIIEDFEYVDIEDVDDLTEYILSIWVLLEVDDLAQIDDNENLIEGTPLYNLNDAICDSLIQDNKERFVAIIKEQLLIAEKYEILALMSNVLG